MGAPPPAGGMDGSLRVWHVQLLQSALTLDTGSVGCQAVAFPSQEVSEASAHGHFLAAGTADGNVVQYD